ncbi:hypothetical protein CEXT_240791 [Caerostris extrusa]|uniref:Uncharacterized protein n=1 Tax=Caerostris extrusa TaxID=172846 RepID=A0AAV4XE14_CAEEX|nr:hypothetical protein CEXT_240791 [Caerostris extrusa]
MTEHRPHGRIPKKSAHNKSNKNVQKPTQKFIIQKKKSNGNPYNKTQERSTAAENGRYHYKLRALFSQWNPLKSADDFLVEHGTADDSIVHPPPQKQTHGLKSRFFRFCPLRPLLPSLPLPTPTPNDSRPEFENRDSPRLSPPPRDQMDASIR